MFPLTLARTGEKLIICKINADHEIKTRFKELGFCEGAEITVTLAERGNLIIKTKESSYAIDRDFAQNIFVSQENYVYAQRCARRKCRKGCQGSWRGTD